jgi:hypothetical protein
MYYKDPDDNHVELQIDNVSTPEAMNAFLDGPQFSENPIGEDFDPHEMVARFNAGVSPNELVKLRKYGPRGPETIPISNLGLIQGRLSSKSTPASINPMSSC